MITSDTIEDKPFGSNLTASDLELLTLLPHSIGNEYYLLLLNGSEVDRINFESHSTNIVVAVLEIINHHLKSFKLRLAIEEPVSIRDPLMRFFES